MSTNILQPFTSKLKYKLRNFHVFVPVKYTKMTNWLNLHCVSNNMCFHRICPNLETKQMIFLSNIVKYSFFCVLRELLKVTKNNLWDHLFFISYMYHADLVCLKPKPTDGVWDQPRGVYSPSSICFGDPKDTVRSVAYPFEKMTHQSSRYTIQQLTRGSKIIFEFFPNSEWNSNTDVSITDSSYRHFPYVFMKVILQKKNK